MSADAVPNSRTTASPAKTILPPFLVLQDFLDRQTVAGLLDYALSREADFAPTKTGPFEKEKINPNIRVSTGLRDLGPFKPVLKSKIRDLVPDFVAKLRTTPVETPKIELELVAHNDGAFYKRHTDTQKAADRHNIRVLSGVYYFYSIPKAFFGGALRLHSMIGEKKHVDVEPVHNSLLVFPSWAPHEVMPVSCPSGRFVDSRFAINCWVHRTKSETAST